MANRINRIDGVKRTDAFRVPVEQLLEEDGFNVRQYERPDLEEYIENLAKSYAEGKYVPPLVVRVAPDDRIFVVEGHCRRRGALMAVARGAELPGLMCVPFIGNEVARVELMLRSGQGIGLTPLEMALGCVKLEGMNFTADEIAEKISKSSARVRQLLLLGNAEVDVHELVLSGKVSADVAIDVVREKGEKAGATLKAMIGSASAKGKSKVRSNRRGLPGKVVKRMTTAVTSLVRGLPPDVMEVIEDLEFASEEELRRRVIEVKAEHILALIRAQRAADEAAPVDGEGGVDEAGEGGTEEAGGGDLEVQGRAPWPFPPEPRRIAA